MEKQKGNVTIEGISDVTQNLMDMLIKSIGSLKEI